MYGRPILAIHRGHVFLSCVEMQIQRSMLMSGEDRGGICNASPEMVARVKANIESDPEVAEAIHQLSSGMITAVDFALFINKKYWEVARWR